MLAHDLSAERFLTTPALDIEARQMAAADAAEHRALIGRTLLHYRIVSQLGAGGMGIVYKAIDTRLERRAILTDILQFFARVLVIEAAGPLSA